MPYLNTVTGEYPRHDGDLEMLGWAVGQPLPEGWVECEVLPFPEIGEDETAEPLPPVFDGTKWVQGWTARSLTEFELQIRTLKAIRTKVQNFVPLTPEEAALITESQL